MVTPAMADQRIKVKRDGPRGWHWITAASFDPSKHERVDPVPQPPQDEAQPKSAVGLAPNPPRRLDHVHSRKRETAI